MRLGLLVMLGLAGILLAIPNPVAAGNYGCQSGYYNPGYGVRSYSYYQPTYYPTSYYQPTYNYVPAAPSYVTPPPSTCVDTPNGTVCNHGYGAGSTGLSGGYGSNYDNNILYRIAPELANARLAQEAANAAISGLKVELARQQAEAEAKADRQNNRDFQQTVVQLLQNRQASPVPGYSPPTPATMSIPPELIQAIQQLQADNVQIKAVLERITPRTAEAPTAPPVPQPPAIPAAGGSPNPKAKAAVQGSPAEIARKGVMDKAHGCMPCHATNNARKLTDLTDPEKLGYGKLTDCVNRMISSDPKFVMPKDKPPGTVPAEVVGAFHDLSRVAK
jgi:hypothetical protein